MRKVIVNSLLGGFLGCVIGTALGVLFGVIVVIGAIVFASRQTPGLNGIVLAPFLWGFMLAILGGITGVISGIAATKQPRLRTSLLLGFAPGALEGLAELMAGQSLLRIPVMGVTTLAIFAAVILILERRQRSM